MNVYGSIFTSMNSLARVSLESVMESGLLTEEYGYFHMLYQGGRGRGKQKLSIIMLPRTQHAAAEEHRQN